MDEQEARVISFCKKLSPADGNNFIELYTPSSVGPINLDGYLSDLLVTVDISSIAELPELPPSDTPLETDSEKDARYYQLIKSHPTKFLGIYFSEPGEDEKKKRVRIPVWNSRPGYEEDLIPRLTKANLAAIAHGCKLWARVESLGTGALEGTDELTISVSGTEGKQITPETYKIETGIPTNYTVTTTSAVVLAANELRKLATIFNRSGSIAYLNYGNNAVAGAGISLNPGGSSHSLNVRTTNYRGPIAAVTSEGTAQLEILECI